MEMSHGFHAPARDIEVDYDGDCIAWRFQVTTYRYLYVYQMHHNKPMHAILHVLRYVSARVPSQFAAIRGLIGAHGRYAVD
jgi:hypothetical protein